MGRSITCPCGQQNLVDVFGAGEVAYCFACGRPLAREPEPAARVWDSDPFKPEAPEFAEPSGTNPFESPDPEQGDGGVITFSVEKPEIVAPVVEPRAWAGQVREVVREEVSGEHCAQCRRPFRGEWDRNARPEGAICHLCASRADQNYEVPSDWMKRELYRPAPPRKLRQQQPGPEVDEAQRKKRREIVALSIVAVLTLVVVNVFPVEDWAAALFTADREKAAALPGIWNWVARGVNFLVSVIGQVITLYMALAWSRLLYEGGWDENWPTLTYLGVVFAIFNELVMLAMVLFMVLGPAVGILTGMAALVTFAIKMLMISERYPLRIEGGITFLLSWIVCGLMFWPCTFALHRLLNGLLSAILL